MVTKGIGYLIKGINDKLKVRADVDLKEFDLTLTQSRVMGFLTDNGGQATQKEIEVFLGVTHPTVVGVVSRMEQKGFVVSWLDEKDKRNKNVKLTDKANAVGAGMDRQVEAMETMLVASLSAEEVEQLKDMLWVMYNNLG